MDDTSCTRTFLSFAVGSPPAHRTLLVVLVYAVGAFENQRLYDSDIHKAASSVEFKQQDIRKFLSLYCTEWGSRKKRKQLGKS